MEVVGLACVILRYALSKKPSTERCGAGGRETGRRNREPIPNYTWMISEIQIGAPSNESAKLKPSLKLTGCKT